MTDRTTDPHEAVDLYLAAGGGGDPVGTTITAAALAGATARTPGTPGPRTPGTPGARTLVATYAWERPEVDPTPGPLGAAHFTGPAPEDRAYGGTLLLTPESRPVPPAGSTLPRLAADLPARLLLLDPCQGLAAMAAQIRRLADAVGARHVRIVDMGGDILAHGDEDTLCSPLVDALAVAACTLADVDATVYVAGPGTDGEIPQHVLLDRLADARHHTPTARDADTAATALAWHPSEASALFAAAVHGARGTVRTADRLIPLTDASARVYALGLDEALALNTVARHLLDARPDTLDEAADLSARLTGIHELERERRAPADPPGLPVAPSGPRHTAEEAMALIRERASEAAHATYRFAARTLGLDWHHIPALRTLLDADGPLLTLS
ncbi:DUF1152 domain-containing protein [Streptomyces xanthophaeus]|uniref:DUF1152 domain-containing protein n=1 Tax=Streptomyces xanthophaeus TaxID=67385 RepID=UPI0006912BE7|nr:DUF1152 domain-containing protein [Streptomyces xanthophaeus]